MGVHDIRGTKAGYPSKIDPVLTGCIFNMVGEMKESEEKIVGYAVVREIEGIRGGNKRRLVGG